MSVFHFARTFLLSALTLLPVAAADFRPPAVPLVTHDPYFSIWSMADQINSQPTKHWTGTTQSIASLARIDGKLYRITGTDPHGTPVLEQNHLQVLPTHTIYDFEGAGIALTLTFFTPALPDNLDVLSRPVTYVSWNIRSTDGGGHKVEIYLDASAQIAVNTMQERVAWSRYQLGELQILRLGTQQQPILQKSGDDLRIDWGYLYLVAPPITGTAQAAVTRPEAIETFSKTGRVPLSDDLKLDQPYAQDLPVLADSIDFGMVTATPVSHHVLIAYDDLYSVEYFERRLRPYWRRKGMEIDELLRAALADYPSLEQKGAAFDRELTADLTRAGGEKYAQLASLAYRQTFAAHKLTADFDNTPLFFSKENFSNGSIDTVDVTYPSSPFFLLFNPTLLKAQLEPILVYAGLPRWKFPFAPHDLGRYPLANGQQYGGGETSERDQMPIEETGNMLLMIGGIAHIEGNADFAKKYWPVLSKWANYLKEKGLDPENQLCTDDFAGHLAHNANLSIKAILALGVYAKLAADLGQNDTAQQYHSLAQDFAKKWVSLASDGDHFRLAFDRPGTWSQKYNLVWDHLLGLHLFPRDVVEKELAFYRTHQDKYGLPLDNRADYTKLDWLAWTASLSQSKDGFEALFDPAWTYADETPSRVPLSDWYDAKTGKQVGFQARSVVGGIFIQMLYDPAIWNKYAGRAGR
ncbi:MAG TPA: DUF4965 domain-containing protein [Bryobacteraceae bacterium]|jgi:hypothetical protein|nr:DUF4965 domain-containing protein [Bryobacteraceae bacterium]